MVGSYGVGLTFDLSEHPRAGETVRSRQFRIEHGGKGSNQAVAAARLGAHTALLTAVGNDVFADEAIQLWNREGVDAHVVRCDAATMVGGIFVEASGENRIVIAPGALDELRADHVTGFAHTIAGADVVVTQLEAPVEATAQALRIARDHGVRTVLNPAPVPVDLGLGLLEGADYLTPNVHEARRLLGDEALSAQTCAHRLADVTGAVVVLTVGAEGALLSNGSGVVAVPAPRADRVVDTTGAGDTFTAALAVALASGATDEDAVRHGCRAASWSVGFPGVIAGLPTAADVGFMEGDS